MNRREFLKSLALATIAANPVISYVCEVAKPKLFCCGSYMIATDYEFDFSQRDWQLDTWYKNGKIVKQEFRYID